MKYIDEKPVEVLCIDKVEKGIIKFSRGTVWNLYFKCRDIEFSTSSDKSLFNCLCELRNYLSGKKACILCNGARIDAHSSAVSMQMYDGKGMYITQMNMQPRVEDIVDIFDETTIDKIGSVKEQEEYHIKWVESLIESLNADDMLVPSREAIQEAKMNPNG